ncbi:MAG TPA: alpha-hydroxy acid oxidase [Steroidobacteraceae bacterium]|jgi:(S)-mandelate dehydrogenase|nr:alpha-hydroxy acid oxidase [Steroidobacteraceae bacterium]
MGWHRRRYRGRNLERAVTVADLRERAMHRVPRFVFEYVEGGAEDEFALRNNRDAFDALQFVPATLVNTEGRHQRVTLFGKEVASPLIVGPTGGNGVLQPQGDLSLARAAAAAGVPFCLSTMSAVRLENVPDEAGGRLWMQLYVTHNRQSAEDIVARADAAGYEALVFTTDANVFGLREWDQRNYVRPGVPTWRNKLELLRYPKWTWEVLLRRGVPQLENLAPFMPPGHASAIGGSTRIPKLFAARITWEDVAWLRRVWPRKLIIKGVLSVEDAQRCADHGCDGIVLSNHGGRQLEHCVAGLDVLPQIARAVGDRLTLILDGGIRRGTDVIKAIALGADAVMLGRAPLYGLAAGGEPGVRRALAILTTEIDRALGHLGCNTLDELSPAILRRRA